MDRLADKRVAIIGTGATAVQCVPHLAASCAELLVFQRTPSSVDVRDNQPIDPQWFAAVARPGWQERWQDNFVLNMSATESPADDLVSDGWTDLVKRIRGRISAPHAGPRDLADVLADFERADFEKMSEIRARVDAIVSDPVMAERLKAWYRQLCKRPCFHDQYLGAFNLPSVRLIDTGGRGVESITTAGVVVAGTEYPVDCIIYASGFEVGTEPTRRYGFDMTGKDGIRLSDYWSSGMRSLHGIHVHGFPNAFLVQLGQGGNFLANVPHNLIDAAETVAAVISRMTGNGYDAVDATRQAEEAWMQEVLPNPVMSSFLADCTPGYYNNEGQGPSPHSLLAGYQHGAPAYFRYIGQWRDSGDFAGLEFSRREPLKVGAERPSPAGTSLPGG
jgi:cyclohexanone monooxygenase